MKFCVLWEKFISSKSCEDLQEDGHEACLSRKCNFAKNQTEEQD